MLFHFLLHWFIIWICGQMQLSFLLKYSESLFESLEVFDDLLLQCHVLHCFLINSTSILLACSIKPWWFLRWINQWRSLLGYHHIVSLVIWSIKRWWTWRRPVVVFLLSRWIIHWPFGWWLLQGLFLLTWSLLRRGDTVNRTIFICLVGELPPWWSDKGLWFWFIEVKVRSGVSFISWLICILEIFTFD